MATISQKLQEEVDSHIANQIDEVTPPTKKRKLNKRLPYKQHVTQLMMTPVNSAITQLENIALEVARTELPAEFKRKLHTNLGSVRAQLLVHHKQQVYHLEYLQEDSSSSSEEEEEPATKCTLTVSPPTPVIPEAVAKQLTLKKK